MSTAAARRRVLGLFAKEPVPGRVKTRLAAISSPEWAARVARAFLDDTLARFSRIEARRLLVFAPAEARPWFAAVSANRFEPTPQGDGDLGQRLAAFIGDQLAAGADAVVVLGTDSPTLPLAQVDQAFDQLKDADVVLGPATDGGYYLLGCARSLPPIFERVRWGSREVLSDTLLHLRDPAWRVALLPPWYDVDTSNDWAFLRTHVAAMRRAGIDPELPETERLLQHC